MLLPRRLALAGAAAFATPRPGAAQGAWPSRPVRIVVAFAAGGGVDIVARSLAAHFEKTFGQPFPVENRAGAGGRIGTASVARAPGDGYTLMVTSTAAQAAAPALYPDLSYDAVRDFSHISLLCTGPLVLMVNAKAPYATLPEFVSHVKARRTPATYASAGTGSLGHLTGALIAQTLGIPLEHVAYRGAAPALADVLAATLESVVDNFASGAAHYRAGSIRVLATAGRERFPTLPELPTFTELGYPQLVANAWFALSASPGLPADVTTKLHAATLALLEQPAARDQLLGLGMQAEGRLPPAAVSAFIADEVARWTAVVRSAGIKPE